MRSRISIAALLLHLTVSSPAGPETSYQRLDILTASSGSNSRDQDWKPGKGLVLEVSGLCWIGPDRLGVAIRKGEIWFIDGVLGDDPAAMTYTLFASGLQEPLGLLPDGDGFLVAQRAELTRLRDTDGDGRADEYRTAARGWGVTGAYHGYAYGPERDGAGHLWITLNLDMGEHSDNTKGWRGWSLIASPDGEILPQSAGLRSPSGMGMNREGDLFVTDQQGTWVPATPIHHLRKGVFHTNPEGIASAALPGSPLKLSAPMPANVLYPEAVRALPEMVPAAVWLPYNKMGRSATDLQLIDTGGKFGPFEGQLLVGEFTNSAIHRVFLEKVGGEWQGACFSFLDGFPSAVLRLAFAPDGSLFVGMTNRGWSSLGNRAYGLQRVRWTGKQGFAIREMRAKPDGFELTFTEPVDPRSASRPDSWQMTSFTYLHSSAYGSDEMDTLPVTIRSAEPAADGLSVRLRCSGLRELYVHELHAPGLRSAAGAPLLDPRAFYTLNRLPGS